MGISQFLSALKEALSTSARILDDASFEEFKTALERWTDLGLELPGAIVMVATEDDIIHTVRLAATYKVPFVAKSGGHSAWSTISQDGIIIDLSTFKDVIINKSNQTLRVQGGVINQEAIEALYAERLVVPLGGGNTIGVIPSAIGGGINALAKMCGNTSDNILSARMVTATGDIQIVNGETPDLLWAIKGAGQFFGLVTEIELQAYPIEILGVGDGTVYSATYIFDISKFGEISKLTGDLMTVKEYNSAGLAVVTLNPQTGLPCVLFTCVFFGTSENAESLFAPIAALEPIMAMANRIEYKNINDGLDPFMVKGGFKRFALAGVGSFNPAVWPEIGQIFVNLTKERADVAGGYGFEWVTGTQKKVALDSAWAHREVHCWLENLSWYTDPSSGAAVDEAERQAFALETKHVRNEDIHIYQNFSRHDTLESRFGSKDRVEKLKALKRLWDPNGSFTTQLL